MIADVARREDICTSLVFKWRRELREAVEANAGGFAPVVIEPSSQSTPCFSAPSSGSASAVIEVELKDAHVRIHPGAPSSTIAAALKALRR